MYIRIWLPQTDAHAQTHAQTRTPTRTHARGTDTDSPACFCVQLLQMLHGQMEDIDTRLAEAEKIKVAWTPVQDMIIESLPDQLDELKVSSFS